MEGSLIKYIIIAKLFLLVKELTDFIIYQYLYCYIQAEDDDHNKTIYKLEKPFSILVLLEDLINNAFDIINYFLKEIQK